MNKILFCLFIFLVFNVKAQESYMELAKINFSGSDDFDESGWTNIHTDGINWIDQSAGIGINVPSGLNVESFGDASGALPDNVMRSCFYISSTEQSQKVFTISGLNPNRKYTIEIMSSREGIPGSDDGKTSFYAAGSAQSRPGEFLVFDETYTYTESIHGFKWWNIGEVDDAPANANWKSPYDYENGYFYERYHVISQPTDRPVKFQFGFWQDRGAKESLSSQVLVNGPGDVTERYSSPSTWWEMTPQSPLDFSRPNDFYHLGIPMWSDNTKLVSDWESNGDWALKDQYLPMTVHATIVAVADGTTFSGWPYWVGNTQSINSVGNSDSLLVLSELSPDADGKIEITMSKTEGKEGYINAMIVKESTTSKLTMNVSGNGEVNFASGYYSNDTTIQITATPGEGWAFSGWTGDIESDELTIGVSMEKDVNLMANFSYNFPEYIVAQINFTLNSAYDHSEWTNVHGSAELPVTLNNGITLSHDGTSMVGSTSGMTTTLFPASVGGTNIVFPTTQNEPIEFKVSGLIAFHKYNFYFFSSRNSENLQEDRHTSFSIGTDTVKVNSVGNQFDILSIEDVNPNNEGEVIIHMLRHESYSYLNALVIADMDGANAVDALNQSGIYYYPVPVSESLRLRNVPLNSSIVVFDVTGRKVMDFENRKENNPEINMSSAKAGMYFFMIMNHSTLIKTFKIIKE